MARRRQTSNARSSSACSSTLTSRAYFTVIIGRISFPLDLSLPGVSADCRISTLAHRRRRNRTICPHAFSGRAIKELIQQGEGRVHCPVAGCSQTLTLSTIQRDEHLARRVAAHVKRQKEGRTQTGGTQARTYTRMDLSESEEEEEEDGDEGAAAARKVKKEVKKEKAK